MIQPEIYSRFFKGRLCYLLRTHKHPLMHGPVHTQRAQAHHRPLEPKIPEVNIVSVHIIEPREAAATFLKTSWSSEFKRQPVSQLVGVKVQLCLS